MTSKPSWSQLFIGAERPSQVGDAVLISIPVNVKTANECERASERKGWSCLVHGLPAAKEFN